MFSDWNKNTLKRSTLLRDILTHEPSALTYSTLAWDSEVLCKFQLHHIPGRSHALSHALSKRSIHIPHFLALFHARTPTKLLRKRTRDSSCRKEEPQLTSQPMHVAADAGEEEGAFDDAAAAAVAWLTSSSSSDKEEEDDDADDNNAGAEEEEGGAVIGLDAAREHALVAWQTSSSEVRVCDPRRLSAYWAEDDPRVAELSECILVHDLLSTAEIKALLFEVTLDGHYTTASNTMHRVQYLHRGGHWADKWAALSEKLIRAMTELDDDDDDHNNNNNLALRCVELHTYGRGGCLAMPGHRDNGSKVSMSVLLSDPKLEFDGGHFVTWGPRGDAVTYGAQRKGDAIVFRSEKSHNVSTVTRGTRHALVLELWAQPANTHDRFR
jgi:hypothetical protein